MKVWSGELSGAGTDNMAAGPAMSAADCPPGLWKSA